MNSQKKSPLKDKPLRLPGQSLEEELRRLQEEKLETPLLLALFMVVLALMEWARHFINRPVSPWVYTIAALVLAGFVIFRIVRLRPRLRSIRQGIDGERAVGQYLEKFRSNGYNIFHDVIGTGFNIDHILIGPAGIFTVETKTWSKPARGESRITFDGMSVTLPGQEPLSEPVIQARAQAAWLKSVLSESTGKQLNVFPIVLFPGWYIEHADGSLRTIWVLEPKALPKFLENSPIRLESSDISLASSHLMRLIRATARENER